MLTSNTGCWSTVEGNYRRSVSTSFPLLFELSGCYPRYRTSCEVTADDRMHERVKCNQVLWSAVCPTLYSTVQYGARYRLQYSVFGGFAFNLASTEDDLTKTLPPMKNWMDRDLLRAFEQSSSSLSRVGSDLFCSLIKARAYRHRRPPARSPTCRLSSVLIFKRALTVQPPPWCNNALNSHYRYIILFHISSCILLLNYPILPHTSTSKWTNCCCNF